MQVGVSEKNRYQIVSDKKVEKQKPSEDKLPFEIAAVQDYCNSMTYGGKWYGDVTSVLLGLSTELILLLLV